MPDLRFTVIFYLRLALYLLVYLIPVLHPAIVVSYDATTVWLWFLFVPLQMHLAFFGAGRLKIRDLLIAVAAVVAVSVVIVTGFERLAWLFVGVQLAAFGLTVVLFHVSRISRLAGLVELGIVGSLYVRLLGFSRASETFARASGAITQGILAVSIGALILHALLIYLVSCREGVRSRTIRELVMFGTAAAVLGLFVALVMPPDFVSHSVVLNELGDPPDPDLQPLDEEGNGLTGGNLRSDRFSDERRRGGAGSEGDSAEDAEGGQNGSSARLEGIAADEWSSRRGRGEGDSRGDGEGESKQYAVMVVGSSHDPIYAADAYYADLDPRRGFVYSQDETLNDLTYTRLIETWRNPSPAFDPLREETDVFFLSTIPERVVPYSPIKVEPTVLNTRYHPFDYAYSVTSGISRSTPRQWRRIEPLSSEERAAYAEYLEVELAEPYEEEIRRLAEELFEGRSGYFERLQAILAYYTTYQYEIGFTDDVTVPAITEFLTETKNGDCSEFSNATAILARLAGIPARVVTGYLASEELQTPRHTQGLAILRERVEPLSEMPLDELYLVTSAHRHSWTQVLMPGYGWIDIETTATAIPPAGSMNPNAMDVVIPIITPEELEQPGFVFPWLLVGQTLLLLGITAFMAAYLFRFGRRLYLNRLARGESLRALSALYTLVLSHLATEGYPLKPESDTSLEYAERHPELNTFAERYTELRYGPPREREPGSASWDDLRESYHATRAETRRRGFVGFVKRLVSLRELRY